MITVHDARVTGYPDILLLCSLGHGWVRGIDKSFHRHAATNYKRCTPLLPKPARSHRGIPAVSRENTRQMARRGVITKLDEPWRAHLGKWRIDGDRVRRGGFVWKCARAGWRWMSVCVKMELKIRIENINRGCSSEEKKRTDWYRKMLVKEYLSSYWVIWIGWREMEREMALW